MPIYPRRQKTCILPTWRRETAGSVRSAVSVRPVASGRGASMSYTLVEDESSSKRRSRSYMNSWSRVEKRRSTEALTEVRNLCMYGGVFIAGDRLKKNSLRYVVAVILFSFVIYEVPSLVKHEHVQGVICSTKAGWFLTLDKYAARFFAGFLRLEENAACAV